MKYTTNYHKLQHGTLFMYKQQMHISSLVSCTEQYA